MLLAQPSSLELLLRCLRLENPQAIFLLRKLGPEVGDTLVGLILQLRQILFPTGRVSDVSVVSEFLVLADALFLVQSLSERAVEVHELLATGFELLETGIGFGA